MEHQSQGRKPWLPSCYNRNGYTYQGSMRRGIPLRARKNVLSARVRRRFSPRVREGLPFTSGVVGSREKRQGRG